ncbi:prenyltransferase/squalene oxidase repeat-containing protein [Streptomyces melanosporofaciens]|uniref:Prenyltransferase and squalene oxidase repeat-containing protein n=1 Tax=Streptomyces melanosporofaciens TaxID=67327 RepID=A0A1H4MC90_STRMJ|nr:prenyltransferase/squalene oxidase repeat-containing protein [Streptomyces melanosporofaciens]SEB80720.1 Prenyltransferase and squalene oxidase repeat-containing protein [Streptomyces melanosporofaciens]
MNIRHSVAALSLCAALCAALGAAAAPAAVADDSPAGRSKGLYGAKDPKFDGVWRQSLTLLAQDAVGVTPAKSAIDWLAGQGCADGGFAAYRADTSKACDPKKGEFTDATAAAIQALAAVGGRADTVEKGIGWLKRHQNDDGGWGMNPGGPSDANSTSAAIGAFAATGQDPAKLNSKGGKSPYDALLGLQLGCSAKAEERGAFAYTADKGKPVANELATASAALAAQGKGFVFETVGKDGGAAPEPLRCAGGKGGEGGADEADGAGTPKDAAEAALAHLSRVMSATDMHLKSAMPGAKDQPDFGGTADAVVALAAGEHSATAGKPLQWLQGKDSGAMAWAKGDPGALAKLILAAHAAGADPRDFGGVDLVQQLNATGPKPEAAAPGAESDGKSEASEKKSDDGGVGGVWWTVGVCAVAGMGIGFLISGRKRRQL